MFEVKDTASAVFYWLSKFCFICRLRWLYFSSNNLDILMKNPISILALVLLTVSFNSSMAYAESTNAKAWLKPISEGWKVTPLLNVGDTVGAKHYRMVGIPDGLGAFDNGDGTLSIYMNHEIGKDQGKNRKHFGRGAFVSHWTLDIANLKITDGEDLINQIKLWLADDKKHVNAPAYSFNRLCSADLPALSAIYDAASGKGFNGRLFMNGEEDRDGGRGFAHVVTGEQKGISYELPYLGKFAWENAVANPSTGVKTVVMGMDDSLVAKCICMSVKNVRLATLWSKLA